jgi:hypothetical protein
MDRGKPSFWHFLLTKNSFYANFGYGMGFAFCLIGAFGGVQRGLTSDFDREMAMIVASLGILFIAFTLLTQWRKFVEIALVFKNGTETFGRVVEVYFYRRSGYVTCEYQYQQEVIRSTDTIKQNAKTNAISLGQQVMLYVNPQKPSQAYIRDFYLNTF